MCGAQLNVITSVVADNFPRLSTGANSAPLARGTGSSTRLRMKARREVGGASQVVSRLLISIRNAKDNEREKQICFWRTVEKELFMLKYIKSFQSFYATSINLSDVKLLKKLINGNSVSV